MNMCLNDHIKSINAVQVRQTKNLTMNEQASLGTLSGQGLSPCNGEQLIQMILSELALTGFNVHFSK